MLFFIFFLLPKSEVFIIFAKGCLFRGTPKGYWEEIYVLPSNGDTSYPGLLLEGNEVWVSYYSSTTQPGKCAIYLAKLPLSLFTSNGW